MSLNIGVLASTKGTALQGVIDAIESGKLDARIVLVASDKESAPVLRRAARHGISTMFLSPANCTREDYDDLVTAKLQQAQSEVVLLVGYMRILSARFVDAWRGRLLNVHPSLLPAFGGLMNNKVHEAVLGSGVRETGCTIHQVTEELDGGPIVLQKRCPVLQDDTVESLKDRVQALEQEAFVQVLREWKAP